MSAIDTDNPDLRAAVSRLASLLGGQLESVAQALTEGQATPWQLLSICARLDKLKTEIEYMRRDVSKFDKVSNGTDPF